MTPTNTLRGFDDIFSDFFKMPDTFTNRRSPDINIYKNENSYFVEAELPGYSDSEITVDIENGYLSIKGEKKKEESKEKQNIHREFYSQETFERRLKVGSEFDVEKTTAKMKNGVLTVELPLSEKAKPKSIKVKVD